MGTFTTPTMLSRAQARAAALRPLIALTAKRLWRDDLDYAERRYDLRTRG